MIAHYRSSVKEVPGAADTFHWCHAHGIKVGEWHQVDESGNVTTLYYRDGVPVPP